MKTYFLIFICFMLFNLSSVSFAGDPIIIKVGTYENYPKIFTEKDGSISGFWAELLTHISKKEGWKIEWISGTWKECLDRLKNGKIHIMPDTGWTEPRSKIYDFTHEPVLVSWSRLYIPKGSQIKSIIDLEGKTIAALKGSFNLEGPEGIKEIVEKFSLNVAFKEMNTYEEIFNALQSKHIDAGVTNKDFGNQHEDNYTIERTSIIFQAAKMQFALTKGAILTSVFGKTIDDHIKVLKKDKNSIYYHLLEKYIAGKRSETFIEIVPRWIKVLLIFGSALIIFLFAVGIVSRLQVRQRTSELFESERKYKTLIDRSPDLRYRVDRNGKVVFISPSVYALTGFSVDEARGKEPEEFYVTINHKEKFLTSLNEEGYVNDFEDQFKRKDGTHWWASTNAYYYKDDNDNILGIEGVIRDITERKQVEIALRNSENKMRSIFRAAPVGIGIISDRVIQDVNDRICQITGYSKDELIQKSARMLYPTQEEFEYVGKEKYKQIKKYGTGTVETCFKRKDGKIIHILMSSTPLKPDDLLAGVTFTALDITQRKVAEEKLRKSEEKYREYFEEDLSGTYISTPDGQLIAFNQEYKRIFGFENDEQALNTPINNLFQDPNTRSDFLRKISTEKRIASFEPKLKKVNGTPIDLIENASGVFDENGNLKRIRGFILDVSEKKNLELRLLQVQKMEAIGTLAGGIAHDFNNILTGIFGYAQLALTDIHNTDNVNRSVTKILISAKRAADLVQQILTFSRKSEYKKTSLAIYSAINEAINLLRSSIPSTIEIDTQIGSKSFSLADPTKIHQVIMNLCTNAYHAMRKTGGKLNISLKDIRIENPKYIRDRIIPPGNFILLEVRDTGHGMDSLTIEKAFDPYFTTKKVGEGTGLGLAIVQAIVDEHDGFLKITSKLDKGTSIEVFFPIVKEPVKEEFEKNDKISHLEGNEKILFVDDEEAIRQISEEILAKYGYTVTTCENGKDAYHEFKSNPHQFDLVITDMTMPQLTGDKLSEKLLKIRSDIPIILCTGYSNNISENSAKKLGIKKYVSKPISYNKLMVMIREIFEDKNL